MMLAPTECKVTGLKSMYADVQHTTTSDVDTIDSNDVKYSAIAGTRSGPVSLCMVTHAWHCIYYSIVDPSKNKKVPAPTEPDFNGATDAAKM